MKKYDAFELNLMARVTTRWSVCGEPRTDAKDVRDVSLNSCRCVSTFIYSRFQMIIYPAMLEFCLCR
jgi:hypothetical protein